MSSASSLRIRKTIALVAHDNRKNDLLDWANYNRATLVHHHLVATRTTGRLFNHQLDLNVLSFESGPLGGDQQLGAEVTLGNFVISSPLLCVALRAPGGRHRRPC